MSKRNIFVAALRAMAKEDTDFFDPGGRANLVRLADDPDIEQVWTKIEKSRGKQQPLLMRMFIREIIVDTQLAAAKDDWPDYLTMPSRPKVLPGS